MKSYTYKPPFYLRNGMIQSILNSSRLSNRDDLPLLENSEKVIIETKDGEKLIGNITRQKTLPSIGFIILIHGWEGSSESEYIIKNGTYLYEAGYDIFRLNLRDHGDSHHLNKGLFWGTLIDEIFDAIKIVINDYSNKQRCFIIGYSMGGNYAARIASKTATSPIKNLEHIVAINPPIDPKDSTIKIDKSFILRNNFLKKWHSSLIKKEKAFPKIYDFTKTIELKSCMAITDDLVKRYSDFDSTDNYFKGYNITKDWLENVGVDTTILISEDDPIMNIKDFKNLKLDNRVNLSIQKYGGHCGYFTGRSLNSWYEAELLELFKVKGAIDEN